MRKEEEFSMSKSLLITQCLQNDFVEPIGKFDPLPNLLHVGYAESRRLLGEEMADGPVHQVIRWAYDTNPGDLEIIHIRDWHHAQSEAEKNHLEQFGSHCEAGSRGAEFVFAEHILKDRAHAIVDASGLNDFVDTKLADILKSSEGKKTRVGLMGVWTEAKIFFLLYELLTRYPDFELAICSALTASSSRTNHFLALKQIEKILGVKIFSSVGAFTSFLAGSMPDILGTDHKKRNLELSWKELDQVREEDKDIVYYLFRDCKRVELKSLDGGFSGNLVLKAKSYNLLGHKLVPTVIKIGNRDLIAKERSSFEQIQEVMGNNAPHVVEWAEVGERGGIKYRYASMLDEAVTTFQDFYEGGGALNLVEGFLKTIFVTQLGRMYEAAEAEQLNLLQYYDFQSKYAPSVKKNIEALYPGASDQREIELIKGVVIPNVLDFYVKDLSSFNPLYAETHFMAYLHGDLNGKNIVIDAQHNVWLIDFFHTHQGHVLKDLIKLENDLLYIFTKVENETELREALLLSDYLTGLEDLGKPLSNEPPKGVENPKLIRAYHTLGMFRKLYPNLISWDRDPYQWHVAHMRYAMHTLSFEESNTWQKKWALYTGTLCAAAIRKKMLSMETLRVDRIDTADLPFAGQLGITILPGRKDKMRDLEKDLSTLKNEGYTHILSLITPPELEEYGVKDLYTRYKEHGFTCAVFPILDQQAANPAQAKAIFDWMEEVLKGGGNLMIHCAGGLGRSGMMAAGFLKKRGRLSPEKAIEVVRRARTQRALETQEQVKFVHLV